MMAKRPFWLFVVCIHCITELCAQESIKRFEKISVDQGLSHAHILSIYKDSHGYMWFGTYAGLNRYDGNAIKVYIGHDSDSTTLQHNSVHTICEDQQGQLWIGTENGLHLYQRSTDNFKKFTFARNGSEASDLNHIRSIYPDEKQENILWLATYGGGLIKYNYEEDHFTAYRNIPENESSIPSDKVNVLLVDSKQRFWIGTEDGGFSLFDRNTGMFTNYREIMKLSGGNGGDIVNCIEEDSRGNLWIGTWSDAMYRFEPERGKFTHFPYKDKENDCPPGNTIIDMTTDGKGNLWIASYGGGLSKMNLRTHTFQNFKHSTNMEHTIGSDYLWHLYFDEMGQLWIATFGSGVNKLDPFQHKFHLYRADENISNSLAYNDISSILEDHEGIIWIGTLGKGLTLWDRKKNKMTRWFDKKDQTIPLIREIYEDREHRIWIGCDGEIIRIEPDRKTILRYKADRSKGNDPNSLPNHAIYSLCYDKFGDLWLGSWNKGLFRLKASEIAKKNPDDAQFINYSYHSNDAEQINNNTVWCLYEDRQNRIWVGTKSYLKEFDRENETFIDHKVKSVSTLYQDKNGVFWAGTLGDDLYRIEPEKKIYKRYPFQRPSFSTNIIYGILPDDNDENLWISINQHIARFNIEDGKVHYYDRNDGLQRGSFSINAYEKLRTGEMLFGGNQGLNLFHPDSISQNPYPPRTVFTDFKVSNVSISHEKGKPEEKRIPKTLDEIDHVVLNHKDDMITVEFASLSYSILERNLYAYKLDGFDEEWIYTKIPKATYTNLSGGNYTLKVKASNSDGVWSESATVLKIRIKPEPWLTVWAYALYSVIFLLLMWMFRYYISSRERLKNELEIQRVKAENEHNVDEMKLRFFTNVSHEFRTPLTLILAPLEKLISMEKEENEESLRLTQYNIMHRNARRLLRLINELLDLRKLEAGTLKLEAIEGDIVLFVRNIAESFVQLADQNQMNFELKTQIKQLNMWFDPDKIDKIVYNLLSNAFKFTPEGGSICLEVRSDMSGQVKIIVSDTGYGIPEKLLPKVFNRFYQVDSSHKNRKEGSGIGLALSKELVELHRGTIEVESTQNEGTTFTITLPLGKDHLTREERKNSTLPIEHQYLEAPVIGSINLHQTEETLKTASTSDDSPTVLIVEDNPDAREFLFYELQDEYKVILTCDGKEGLRSANEHKPDLIVSDVMMPQMDGFELCNKLKASTKTSHIPIILLTARSSEESKMEGIETGADDYITKPFNASLLKARIKSLISTRQRLRRKFATELNSDASELANTSADEKLLEELIKITNDHLDDFNFNTKALCEHANISKTLLYEKLKALTGQSVAEFIRTIRFRHAVELMKQGYIIKEVAFRVGFKSQAHFTHSFSKQFGVPPSEYVKQLKAESKVST